MAFRDLFTRRRPADSIVSSTPGMGVTATGIASPWSESQLTGLVWSDIFDHENMPVTRAAALRVPAIAAARNRVIEKLAGRPLVDFTVTGRETDQPLWTSRTDSPLAMSPWHRMAATLDDLMFYGWSLWAVERSSTGSITQALHVPFERLSAQLDGTIQFDGEQVPADQVLLIPGPHEGILNCATDTIRAGLDLERAWRSRARNPAPNIILEEREDNGMTLDEARPYVEAVAKARRNPDGAVMFTPYKINARIEGNAGESFLESARNAIRIDVAAYFNLTAQSIEASKNESTLTYETAETADRQATDRMAFWSEPIEHRLSLDDVVPRGHRIRFNFQSSTNALTGTPTED
jgi:hypothetical protein